MVFNMLLGKIKKEKRKMERKRETKKKKGI